LVIANSRSERPVPLGFRCCRAQTTGRLHRASVPFGGGRGPGSLTRANAPPANTTENLQRRCRQRCRLRLAGRLDAFQLANAAGSLTQSNSVGANLG
uniref:Clade I nitrous oxide reductase n=1 Tax=Macrostomum lignano TaxID=282301 RepID=A0A1I8H6N4_9PLAT